MTKNKLSIPILFLLYLLLPASALAQFADRGDHSVYYSTASDTSDAFTIQIPTGGRQIIITNFVIQCIYAADPTAKCSVEYQKGGTAASTTAATIVKLNDKVRDATATVFYNSDAGTGSTVNKVDQPVNAPIRYLSGVVLVGAGSKLTVRITSSSAMEYRYYVDWKEQ